jgi:hypothetical protein
MADTTKWPLSARPMNMGGTGGAKSKGKRRVMISAEAKAPSLKRTRSPESIAKGNATREANAAAKKARADATGRPLERGNRVKRTRNVIGNRGAQKQQVVRGAGSSRIARIRRGAQP